MSRNDFTEVMFIGYGVWNGETDKLLNWLLTPCPAMGGKRPIDYSKDEIINELHRIEYGIFA